MQSKAAQPYYYLVITIDVAIDGIILREGYLKITSMPFTEKIKLAVKKNAHFRCCLCHALGIEIHHIIPQEENGPDTEVNAAPLCPSCHEMYGANPEKRKFIREARDFWYELCEKRYASDAGRLETILKIVQEAATKDDLDKVAGKLIDMQMLITQSLESSLERERYLNQIDNMQQKVLNIERELEAKSFSLLQLQQRQAIMQFGMQIAIEMAAQRSNALDAQVTNAYSKAIGALIKVGQFSPDTFLGIFQNAFSDGPVPEESFQQALYYLCVQYQFLVRYNTAFQISSSVVPFILEEFDKNPNQSIKELHRILLDGIRAGDLDKGAESKVLEAIKDTFR